MSVADRGPRLHKVQLPKLGEVNVYAGVKVGRALEEIAADLTLYEGVRLQQVLEAVYEQGLKNGRAEVFDAIDGVSRRKELVHKNPGRPRTRK